MAKEKSASLKTPRLTLRAMTGSDGAAMTALLMDPEVAKTFMLPEFSSAAEAEKLFRRLREMSLDPLRFVYGVYLGDEIIGFINEVEKSEHEMELGYVISPRHQNRGYATEVLSATITELFRMGYQKVRAGAFEGNIASMRVMEKCGMKNTGADSEISYRGTIHRCINYEISAPAGR